MKTKTLSIELPRIDADTQSRIKINDDAVSDYAELIEASGKTWPFPPIDVFFDGTDHYVADGFQRLLAALRTKRGSIPCVVHKGTAKDARIFGMTANDTHGLRMSRADKRSNVEWLLDCGDKMTQAAIAAAAGVTDRTVRTIVADRKYESVPPKPKPDSRGADRKTSATPTGGGEPDVDSEAVDDDETSPDDSIRDYGKCPVCAGTKWKTDDDGTWCKKCNHPHGEPAGDADEDRMTTQRQKTVKTGEAFMRAFDDLQVMKSKPKHKATILTIKGLIRIAKEWK